MKAALELLRNQVQSLAGRYSDQKKRSALEQAFQILEAELHRSHVQSQRIMQLLRGIIAAQPGSAKAVNQFLRTPSVARVMNAGGNYHLK